MVDKIHVISKRPGCWIFAICFAPVYQDPSKARIFEQKVWLTMKVENGKIVEITESDLFRLYLDRGMDDIMDFNQYRKNFENAGCVVIDGGKDNG